LPEPPGIAEKIRVIRRHLALTVREKGERVAVMEMRKHLGWYLKGVPGSAALRKRANGLETAEEFARFLDDLSAHAVRSGQDVRD
jgi:tRNA-dihydrouridine synthase